MVDLIAWAWPGGDWCFVAWLHWLWIRQTIVLLRWLWIRRTIVFKNVDQFEV